jgi:hypothetical protein
MLLCFLANEEEEMRGREKCEVLIYLKSSMKIPFAILTCQVPNRILIDFFYFFIPLLFSSEFFDGYFYRHFR